MKKNDYLSFIIKNSLTWMMGGFRVCGMNATEMDSQNGNVRLSRIKTTSRIFRWILNGFVLFVLVNIVLFVLVSYSWIHGIGTARGIEEVWHMEGMGGNTGLGLLQPVIGIVIVFIAWIMDEGRKIQEEQALTV